MPNRRFFTGSTGVSTGPHLHAALFDVEAQAWVDPTPHMGALLFQGKPLEQAFPRTSGYGHRTAPTAGASSFHQGVDVGTPVGTEVEVSGGSWRSTADNKGYGRESIYDWADSRGKRYQWRLAHGSADLNPVAALGETPTPGSASAPGSAPAATAPAPEAAPDWRAAASDPGRSRDPMSAAYWQREDIKQWAAANPQLARPMMAAAGVASQLEQLPQPAAPAATAGGDFKPVSRGALGGVQSAPLPQVDPAIREPLENHWAVPNSSQRWLQVADLNTTGFWSA